MDFQKEVIEKSREIPVLVDFWAPWCGPCRVLGPKLEKLAEEAEGEWVLFKLNTEEYPELAQQYHIMSIPNVKLFIDGTVVSEFAGAYPENWIKDWLADLLPNKEEKEWSDLSQELQALDDDSKISRLQEFLEKYADNPKTKVRLARLFILKDPEKAESLLSSLKLGDKNYDSAQYLKAICELLNLDPNSYSDPDIIQSIQDSLLHEEFEKAAAEIISWLIKDKLYQDELPRRAGIGLFEFLGKDHEVTKKYRRKFDMAIY